MAIATMNQQRPLDIIDAQAQQEADIRNEILKIGQVRDPVQRQREEIKLELQNLQKARTEQNENVISMNVVSNYARTTMAAYYERQVEECVRNGIEFPLPTAIDDIISTNSQDILDYLQSGVPNIVQRLTQPYVTQYTIEDFKEVNATVPEKEKELKEVIAELVLEVGQGIDLGDFNSEAIQAFRDAEQYLRDTSLPRMDHLNDVATRQLIRDTYELEGNTIVDENNMFADTGMHGPLLPNTIINSIYDTIADLTSMTEVAGPQFLESVIQELEGRAYQQLLKENPDGATDQYYVHITDRIVRYRDTLARVLWINDTYTRTGEMHILEEYTPENIMSMINSMQAALLIYTDMYNEFIKTAFEHADELGEDYTQEDHRDMMTFGANLWNRSIDSLINSVLNNRPRGQTAYQFTLEQFTYHGGNARTLSETYTTLMDRLADLIEQNGLMDIHKTTSGALWDKVSDLSQMVLALRRLLNVPVAHDDFLVRSFNQKEQRTGLRFAFRSFLGYLGVPHSLLNKLYKTTKAFDLLSKEDKTKKVARDELQQENDSVVSALRAQRQITGIINIVREDNIPGNFGGVKKLNIKKPADKNWWRKNVDRIQQIAQSYEEMTDDIILSVLDAVDDNLDQLKNLVQMAMVGQSKEEITQLNRFFNRAATLIRNKQDNARIDYPNDYEEEKESDDVDPSDIVQKRQRKQ